MLLVRYCCLSAICQRQSVSPWSWPKQRTWSGLMERPWQVWDWPVTYFDIYLKTCTHPERSLFLMLTDPFVKVYLLQDGRKISKKKTSMKRDDTNPIFNEAMIFSVPAIVLQVKASICLSVCLSVYLYFVSKMVWVFFRSFLWEWRSLRAQRMGEVKT